MKEYDIRYRTLWNGVKHLDIRDQSREMVATAVHIKTGSVNDTKPGINHADEHNVFKGTSKMTEGTMALKVDRLGANHSANTEKEHTIFYMETAAEKARKNVLLLGEVITDPTFPGSKMKLETGVLVSEISDYKDDPTSTVEELFEGLMFKGSDMAKPILGTKRSVRSYTRNEIMKYHDQWFRGDNVLVVTAGRTRGLGPAVEKAFSKIPAEHVEKYEGSADYGEPGTEVITDSTEQAHFVLGVPSVTMDDPRHAAFQIIEVILGGHSITDSEFSVQSSRLYNALRVKRGMTYEVSAKFFSGRKVGYLAIAGKVRPHLFHSVRNIVKDQLFNLPGSVTREEVARAKEFWNLYYLKKAESTLDLALLMGLPALMFDAVEQPAEMLEKIQAVRLKDIRDVAEEFITEDKMRLAVLGPFDEDLKRIKKPVRGRR